MYQYSAANVITRARFRWNEMWKLKKRDEIGVAVQSWSWVRVELVAW